MNLKQQVDAQEKNNASNESFTLCSPDQRQTGWEQTMPAEPRRNCSLPAEMTIRLQGFNYNSGLGRTNLDKQ